MRLLPTFKRLILAAAFVLAALPAFAQLDPLPWDQGAVGLGLVLRRLPTTGRVLYVTAHPDDENNAVLVALSRGRGLRTALLTLTRGEGGQNAIGAELGEALGVLRSEELLALHRYDGAEQFFGAAYEFGFSYDLEETLAKWGHEPTLGDVVYVVRSFRPDVILTLPTTAPDHQHHVAAGRLAVEAFRAAADPLRFADQIEAGLRPWQARSVYVGGVGGGNEIPKEARPVAIATAAYDPLLGMTWGEFGSLERTMHKCQGSRQLRVGPGDWPDARYVLADSQPKLADPTDVLDGVDLSLAGLARFAAGEDAPFLAPELATLDGAVRRAQAAYDARSPHAAEAPLAEALGAVSALLDHLRESGMMPDAREEIVSRLEDERHDLIAALVLARGLTMEATSDAGDVVPGQTLAVRLRVFNPGPDPVELEGVALRAPAGWRVRQVSQDMTRIGPAQSASIGFEVTAAADAAPTQPYWRRAAGHDRYDIVDPTSRSLPFGPPDLYARVRYSVAGEPSVDLERPVLYRYEGRWVGGEKQKIVNVVPALSVALAPSVTVFPAGAPARRELRVTVRQNGREGGEAVVRLETPAGWTCEPPQARLRLAAPGEEAVARFSVTTPAGVRAGEHAVTAVAVRGGTSYHDTLQIVAYDHIQERHLLRPAAARALAMDVRVAPGASVGYVMGSGDDVPDALRQLGVPVTLLSADDLASGDLSRYTTLVTGIRAYGARKDLRAQHERLMRYVAEGGNLLVQYNRDEFNVPAGAQGPAAASPFAPFPARATSSRVTDESAPVEVLVPTSPVFSTPNAIAARDWAGWVQERGIQLLETHDSRYTDLVASADPFALNPGRKTGLLVVARVGKGTWTYVGLALWRQLPAGVPGAYRLLANLVSRPRGR